MVVVEVHLRLIGTAVGAVHLLDGLTIVVCILKCVYFTLFRILKKKKKISFATPFFIW